MISSEDAKRPVVDDESTLYERSATNTTKSPIKATMRKNLIRREPRCTSSRLLSLCLNLMLMAIVVCMIAIQYSNISKKTRFPDQLPIISKRMLSTFDELMPGVTICTSNTVDRAKLQQLPDVTNKLEFVVKNVQPYRRAQLELEKERIVKKLIETAAVQRFSKLAPSSFNFINQVFCDQTKWIKSEDRYSLADSCSNLYRVRSVEKTGTCFTLFHFAAQFAAKEYGSRDEDNYEDRDQIYFMLGELVA